MWLFTKYVINLFTMHELASNYFHNNPYRINLQQKWVSSLKNNLQQIFEKFQ